VPPAAGLATDGDDLVAMPHQPPQPFVEIVPQGERFLLLGNGLDKLANAVNRLVAGAGQPDVVENLLQAVVHEQQLALALIELVLAGIAAAAKLQHLLVAFDDLLDLGRGEILGQADAAKGVLPAALGLFHRFLGRPAAAGPPGAAVRPVRARCGWGSAVRARGARFPPRAGGRRASRRWQAVPRRARRARAWLRPAECGAARGGGSCR
jgi:hypothetical protein